MINNQHVCVASQKQTKLRPKLILHPEMGFRLIKETSSSSSAAVLDWKPLNHTKQACSSFDANQNRLKPNDKICKSFQPNNAIKFNCLLTLVRSDVAVVVVVRVYGSL